MATSPLQRIKNKYTEGYYPGYVTPDISYLLGVIAAMERNVQDMALAYQDPDNDCPCVHRVQDDAGTTVVYNHNNNCPTHKGE